MTEGQKQDTLYREMEGELLIIETTFREAGLCIGNIISMLEARVHELRDEEQKHLAEMEEDAPAEDDNAEHRLGAKQLI